MNKFALILPLVMLSFLLGYFMSSSQTEEVYAILAAATIFVAIMGFLFLVKPQQQSRLEKQ
ncbi:MAG: hypothetical protein WC325_03225 [Candidatus Bathyarchaeia archaeon]